MCLAFVPLALARAEIFSESDTFWQIRAGIDTISNQRIPTVDPYSWTAAGEGWTLNSWGFNVLLALAFQAGGLVLVALVCAGLATAVAVLVLLLARDLKASPAISGWFLVIVSPLLIAWLSARPQLVDYAAVLVLVVVLRRMLDSPSLWQLGALGVLSVVWVNLHAASLLGVGIAGGTAAVAALHPAARRRCGWLLGGFGIVFVGSLANPYGAGIFTQTAQVKAASAGITEWQPLNPGDPVQLISFALGLVALVIAAARRDIVFSAALLVAGAGSVVALRILPVLLLLAVPVLMSGVSRSFALRYFQSRRKMLAQGAALGMGVITALVASNLASVGRPNPDRYPSGIIQAIPAGCHVFNDYTLGGLLILERPDVKVSLDSRNDLYGAERVSALAGFIESGGGSLRDKLSGADCVLVSPGSGLAKRLRTEPEWRLAGEERSASLYIRAGLPLSR
ncbi:hypothetical protein [Arthrobacter sp. H-02-3]|uniref:hypothetical protein n=1 Tax=Arthrobacter sp. H-02-3 TaxID=2703675 RepID=UPI0013796836|nr:hypothetical protein [Arthrobacter sp. H-02-3]